MFFLPKKDRQTENKDYDYSLFDPLLGHAQNHEASRQAGYDALPGYERTLAGAGSTRERILVYGGSTSSRLELCNWPALLAETLAQQGQTVEILNGAMAGYTSSQEFLKMMRDVPALKPDQVIVLSGINDIGFMWSAPDHPMVHLFQANVAASVARGADAFSGFSLGPEDKRPAHQVWLDNVRLMNQVCRLHGIICQIFLQPVLGAGQYRPAGEDADIFRTKVVPRKLDKGGSYLSELRHFYAGVQKALHENPQDYDFLKDISGLFDAEVEAVYRDSRHPDARGNRLIAEAIARQVVRSREG